MLRTVASRAAFPFKARWEEVEREVPVLRRIEGAELALKVSTAATSGGTGARAGQINWTKMPLSKLAQLLGSFGYRRLGLDETGLSGEYDVDLSWTPGDVKSLDDALAKVGLRFSKRSAEYGAGDRADPVALDEPEKGPSSLRAPATSGLRRSGRGEAQTWGVSRDSLPLPGWFVPGRGRAGWEFCEVSEGR